MANVSSTRSSASSRTRSAPKPAPKPAASSQAANRAASARSSTATSSTGSANRTAAPNRSAASSRTSSPSSPTSPRDKVTLSDASRTATQETKTADTAVRGLQDTYNGAAQEKKAATTQNQFNPNDPAKDPAKPQDPAAKAQDRAKGQDPGKAAEEKPADKPKPEIPAEAREAYDVYKTKGDNYLSSDQRKQLQDSFRNSEDPALREMMAPAVLSSLRDSGSPLHAQALDAMKESARNGDPEALKALAEYTSSSINPQQHSKTALGLLDSANKNGHASEVMDSLLAAGDPKKSIYGFQDTNGTWTEAVGMTANQLPKGDPRIQGALDTMRNTFTAKGSNFSYQARDGAVRGLGHMAQYATKDDAKLVAGQLHDATGSYSTKDGMPTGRVGGVEAARSLNKILPNFSPEEQRSLLEPHLKQLTSEARGSTGSALTLREMSGHLRAEDIQGLKGLGTDANIRRENMKTLEGFLGRDADPDKRMSAARVMADGGGREVTPEQRRSLVDIARSTGDPGLKKDLLNKVLPGSPIGDKQLEGFAQNFSKSFGEAIAKAPEGSGMHELGKLLSARHLASDEKFKGKVDVEKLDAKIQAMMNRPDVKAQMDKLRQGVAEKTFGGDAGKQLDNYIRSDEFGQRLELMNQQERDQAIGTEMGKLAGLSPDKVQGASEHLLGKALQADPSGVLEKATPQQREQAVNQLIDNILNDPSSSHDLKEHAKALKKSGKAVEKLAKALPKLADAGRRLEDAVEAGEGAAENFKFLRDLDKSGKLGTFVAGAGVAALMMNGMPDSWKDTVARGGDLMSIASKADDVGRLFKLSEASKLAPMLKTMKWAGPAADIVGAGLDGYGSYKDFKQGDYFGGSMKAIGAGAGVTSAVAGVCILAGATGPAAPLVLAGAAVVGLAAWGADALWGKSDEQSLLENMGVWKG